MKSDVNGARFHLGAAPIGELPAAHRGRDASRVRPIDRCVGCLPRRGDGNLRSGRRPPNGFDDELRRLLRGRLLLIHLLALALIVLLAAMIRLTPTVEQEGIVQPRESYFWGRLAAQFAEAVIGTFALWSFSAMTLRSLRLWELTFFATYAAAAGFNRFAALAAPIEGIAGSVPALAVGFSDLTSLQGFIILILAYGVLIPNSPRRSMLVVAVLTAVPLAIIPAAAMANPTLHEGRVLGLIVQSTLCLTFPAAIALFAAARATALQRRAFEAERRAERVDQYTLKRKLGEGSMGEVWLAEHRLLKRPCAVKFIRAELAAHPAIAARFAREVQAITGLTHPNTVRVYDYGCAADGSFYYVMEYLDGPTLEELVRRAGPLPPGRVVYLLRQICGALAEAHAAGSRPPRPETGQRDRRHARRATRRGETAGLRAGARPVHRGRRPTHPNWNGPRHARLHVAGAGRGRVGHRCSWRRVRPRHHGILRPDWPAAVSSEDSWPTSRGSPFEATAAADRFSARRAGRPVRGRQPLSCEAPCGTVPVSRGLGPGAGGVPLCRRMVG